MLTEYYSTSRLPSPQPGNYQAGILLASFLRKISLTPVRGKSLAKFLVSLSIDALLFVSRLILGYRMQGSGSSRPKKFSEDSTQWRSDHNLPSESNALPT